MMRSYDKDDGALSLPRHLPRPATPDLAKEQVDHGLPHHDEEVVEHVGRERSPLVKSHGDTANEGAGEADKGRGKEESKAAEGGRDDD